jgi:hypothetical protein
MIPLVYFHQFLFFLDHGGLVEMVMVIFLNDPIYPLHLFLEHGLQRVKSKTSPDDCNCLDNLIFD